MSSNFLAVKKTIAAFQNLIWLFITKKHFDLLFEKFMPQMMSTVEKLTKVHNKSRLFPFLMVMENVAVSSWSRIWPG